MAVILFWLSVEKRLRSLLCRCRSIEQIGFRGTPCIVALLVVMLRVKLRGSYSVLAVSVRSVVERYTDSAQLQRTSKF